MTGSKESPEAAPRQREPGEFSRTASLAAGGGSGGVLVYLVNAYTEPPVRDLLIYLTPTFAIFVSGLYASLSGRIARAFADWELRRELTKARLHLERIEANPSASDTHKAEARKRVEALELLVMSIHEKRAQAIVEDD